MHFIAVPKPHPPGRRGKRAAAVRRTDPAYAATAAAWGMETCWVWRLAAAEDPPAGDATSTAGGVRGPPPRRHPPLAGRRHARPSPLSTAALSGPTRAALELVGRHREGGISVAGAPGQGAAAVARRGARGARDYAAEAGGVQKKTGGWGEERAAAERAAGVSGRAVRRVWRCRWRKWQRVATPASAGWTGHARRFHRC